MNKKLSLIVIKEFGVQRPEKMISIERVVIVSEIAQDWLFVKILARFPNKALKHSTVKQAVRMMLTSKYGFGYVFCENGNEINVVAHEIEFIEKI